MFHSQKENILMVMMYLYLEVLGVWVEILK